MPLRVRLIALIGLVLLVSLACGSVLVGWHAAKSVRTELRAALDVGAKTIRNGIDELRTHGRARRRVAAFGRHVQRQPARARDVARRAGSAGRRLGAVRAGAAGAGLVPRA